MIEPAQQLLPARLRLGHQSRRLALVGTGEKGPRGLAEGVEIRAEAARRADQEFEPLRGRQCGVAGEDRGRQGDP